LTVAGFEPQGYFDGRPYRFDGDGGIFSVSEGRVVRFADFESFVTVVPAERRLLLPLLLLLFALAVCVSLVVVQRYYNYLPIIKSDPHRLLKACVNELPAVGLILLVSRGRASFGFAVTFYLLAIVVGYTWMIPFSAFAYDQDLATLSIYLSASAFALPAVFLKLRLPRPQLSTRSIDWLLTIAMLLSAVVLVASSSFHFRIVGISEIYNYRGAVELPRVLRYGFGIVVGAVLPFAFAVYAARRRWGLAVLAAGMLICFYPVSLMKLPLFAPAWLVFLLVLFRFAEERVAIVLSLLLPLLAGLATMIPRGLGFGDDPHVNALFGVINFRMLAVPAISQDLYTEFFSRNSVTWFCQVSLLKPFVACPYGVPLSELLGAEYGFGSLNASLFATEGVASVGLVYAPFAALACGVVVAIANAMSRHLPPRFVIVSAGIALQSFLSVPLTTMLLTNGAATLFLLWYLMPASYLAAEAGRDVS
jgi:hypothetical protein